MRKLRLPLDPQFQVDLIQCLRPGALDFLPNLNPLVDRRVRSPCRARGGGRAAAGLVVVVSISKSWPPSSFTPLPKMATPTCLYIGLESYS
ncbi:hypothetical protein ACP70R_023782 [Stipagrostis hirtigluma subsp. patula]